MVEGTKGSLLKTVNMALEFTIGQMVASILVNGKMENSMESESTHQYRRMIPVQVQRRQAIGKKVKELSG